MYWFSNPKWISLRFLGRAKAPEGLLYRIRLFRIIENICLCLAKLVILKTVFNTINVC